MIKVQNNSFWQTLTTRSLTTDNKHYSEKPLVSSFQLSFKLTDIIFSLAEIVE